MRREAARGCVTFSAISAYNVRHPRMRHGYKPAASWGFALYGFLFRIAITLVFLWVSGAPQLLTARIVRG